MNVHTLRFGGAAALLVGLVTLAMLKTETVDAGHHLVLVDRPYLPGFHEGVRPEPVTDGRAWLFRSTDAIAVSVVPQNLNVTVDDFADRDGILLDFETSIQFRVTDAPRLIDKFGAAWFNSNVKQQYLAAVREAVKKRSMSELMSDPSAAAKIDDEVTAALRAIVKDAGLPVQVVGVALGRAKPNETVLKQMNETAAQQQRKKTLTEATAAERQREQEQVAKADADNAYRNRMNMSPEQFIQLESIRAYAAACAKSPHCIVTSGQTTVQVPAK